MPNNKERSIYTFFMATYFAQGMVGIAYVPIAFLLKEKLMLSAAQSGAFIALMTLPFLLKPFLGLITDSFPLGGRRRAPYLLMASATTSAGWATMAIMQGYAYWPILILLTIVNTGMAFSDVLCDGIMVEFGQKEKKTGPYQAAQIGTLYLTLFITGIGGGWLAEHAPYRAIFTFTALFPLLIFITTFMVPESPASTSKNQIKLVWQGLSSLLSAKSFWIACLVVFLFSFAPFLGTALFYFQADTLGLSKIFIGALTSVGGISGALGALVFWKIYNKKLNFFNHAITFKTTSLLRISILAGAPLTLLYIGYRGQISAILLTALFGAFGVIMRLSLMDVLAKACPRHAEATAFALFMSVFSLAAWTSNALGAWGYEMLSSFFGPYSSVAALVCLTSLCIAACWPLLRWLPSARSET
ncbi:MFS transporter [Elusimicrobiota bacterium]